MRQKKLLRDDRALRKAVAPPPQSDPLVILEIKKLQVKAADLQRKANLKFETKGKNLIVRNNKMMLNAQQRIDVSEAALA